MALTRLIGGEHVEMTPQEEADYLDDQARIALRDDPIRLRQEFIDEGIVRIAAEVPEWNDFNTIGFIASIWNMLDTASASPAQNKAKDIYLFVKDTAIPAIVAMTTQAELDAVDPAAAEPFGAGQPAWP